MIRIRTGNRWKSDRKLGAPSAAEEAWDALGIEVDGIDISGGLLEGHLFPSLASLVEALDSLLSGKRTAHVSFPSGVLLLLARRGATIRLSLVQLVRPSRVLARDVEVDLAEFGHAAAQSGTSLIESLSSRFPGTDSLPLVRRLAGAVASLHRLIPLEGEEEMEDEARESAHFQRRPKPSDVPTFGFDLRDDEGRIASYREGDGLEALLVPGHLYLHGPDGEELIAVQGIPFLLLRDLAATALRMVDPLPGGERIVRLPLGHDGPEMVVDLQGEAFTVSGRTLLLRPRDLARSIFTAVLDLGGVLVGRNPLLAENPYMLDLLEEARSRMLFLDEWVKADARQGLAPSPGQPETSGGIGPPPVAGDLRKASLRQEWRVDLSSIRSVHPVEGGAWISHLGGCTLLDFHGAERADFPEGNRIATAAAKDPVLLLEEGGALLAVDPSGEALWRRETDLLQIAPTYLHRRDGTAWMLVEGTSLLCVDLRTGEERFRLDPPATYRASLSAAGSFLALAADNGMLYALNLDRREIAWRLPIRLGPLAVGSGIVVSVADGASGWEAVGIDAASRTLLFRTPLPLETIGAVLPGRSGTVITGATGVGGEILQISHEGSIRWRALPVLGPGPPSIVRAGGTLFARGALGACRIDRGKVRWSAPGGPGGAPVIVEGMVALPGERLSLRDAATGRELLVKGAAAELPAADHLIPGDGRLIACDIHGSCVGLRLAGALAVV